MVELSQYSGVFRLCKRVLSESKGPDGWGVRVVVKEPTSTVSKKDPKLTFHVLKSLIYLKTVSHRDCND